MSPPSSSNRYNSGCILISILLNNPLLIICQIRPRIKCSLPSARSLGPILTTETTDTFRRRDGRYYCFSVIWKRVERFRLAPCLLRTLLSTRSSIVSGTESLINLHNINPSDPQPGTGVSPTSTFIKQLHSLRWDRQNMPQHPYLHLTPKTST